MLRKVSLELTRRFRVVSVIARSEARLHSLAREAAPGGSIDPVRVDYHDEGALRGAVTSAIERHGPIGLVVSWIHGSALGAGRAIADAVASAGRRCDFLHVRGSAGAAPPGVAGPLMWADLPAIRGRVVILGFVRGPDGSRWLTDDEIATGVLGAIASGAPQSVVGVVSPWSDRPAAGGG